MLPCITCTTYVLAWEHCGLGEGLYKVHVLSPAVSDQGFKSVMVILPSGVLQAPVAQSCVLATSMLPVLAFFPLSLPIIPLPRQNE